MRTRNLKRSNAFIEVALLLSEHVDEVFKLLVKAVAVDAVDNDGGKLGHTDALLDVLGLWMILSFT